MILEHVGPVAESPRLGGFSTPASIPHGSGDQGVCRYWQVWGLVRVQLLARMVSSRCVLTRWKQRECPGPIHGGSVLMILSLAEAPSEHHHNGDEGAI